MTKYNQKLYINCIVQARSEKRVLIVGDNEYVGNLLSDFFSLNGYETTLAGSFDEVLQALKEKSCGLLIIDLNMPEMDGMELISKVRNLTAPVKIIGTSFEDNKKYESLKSGADYFLLRPFNFHYLRFILNAIEEK